MAVDGGFWLPLDPCCRAECRSQRTFFRRLSNEKLQQLNVASLRNAEEVGCCANEGFRRKHRQELCIAATKSGVDLGNLLVEHLASIKGADSASDYRYQACARVSSRAEGILSMWRESSENSRCFARSVATRTTKLDAFPRSEAMRVE